MGKDQDLIQVVKDRDAAGLQKLLLKMKVGKQNKSSKYNLKIYNTVQYTYNTYLYLLTHQ